MLTPGVNESFPHVTYYEICTKPAAVVKLWADTFSFYFYESPKPDVWL